MLLAKNSIGYIFLVNFSHHSLSRAIFTDKTVSIHITLLTKWQSKLVLKSNYFFFSSFSTFSFSYLHFLLSQWRVRLLTVTRNICSNTGKWWAIFSLVLHSIKVFLISLTFFMVNNNIAVAFWWNKIIWTQWKYIKESISSRSNAWKKRRETLLLQDLLRVRI